MSSKADRGPRRPWNLRSSFWLFAAIGALVTKKRSPERLDSLELRWADAAAALFTVVVVRLMVRGIPFSP
jgi:hypothetical protein